MIGMTMTGPDREAIRRLGDQGTAGVPRPSPARCGGGASSSAVDRVDGWGGAAGPALSVRRHDRDVLCLAGVGDRGRDPVTGGKADGADLLTVEAGARMRSRGVRMPVVLDPDWLDGTLDEERLWPSSPGHGRRWS